MTSPIPEFAPGCFGSVLGFKTTDMICGACVFSGRCAPVHEANMARMREMLGVQMPEPAPEPVIVVTAVDPARLTLPKKVQTLLEKLDAGDFDIIEKLRNGINPFGATMPNMAVACHLLLRLGRPVDREILTTALMSRLKWSRATAEEQARVVNYALIHVGAVNSIDGNMTLKAVLA